MPSASSASPLSAPVPPAAELLATVRSSCRAARESSGIRIPPAAIDACLRKLDRATFERLRGEHGVAFPLRFETTLSEVNFLAVLALLNTLSAYRAPFHAATGQGAYQNVIKLCFALFLAHPDAAPDDMGKLSAAGLCSITPDEVAQIWGVSLFQERPAGIGGGVTISERGGEMNEIVQLVVELCHGTGQRLQQAGFKNLGTLVLAALKDAERAGTPEAALGTAIEMIVRVVPGFADMYLLDGHEPVYLFKKVFFLLFALHMRLRESLKLPDVAALPMFVDNVLPTMAKAFGLIDLSESSVPALKAWARDTASADSTAATGAPREGPRLQREDAYKVRAATLDAGAQTVAAAHALAESEPKQFGWLGSITEGDLDGYLWAVAKDDSELRRIPRLVERGTIMY